MVISAIIGLLLGFISSKTFLIHSWLALVPWGLVGIGVGFIAKEKKHRLWSGALYGFFLCVSFLVGGFQGKSVGGLVVLTLAIGAAGALCGLVLAYISVWIKPGRQEV